MRFRRNRRLAPAAVARGGHRRRLHLHNQIPVIIFRPKKIQRLHHSFTAHLHNNPAPSSCARCSNGQKLTAAAELEKITRSSGSLRNSGIKSGRIIPPDPDEFSDRPGGRWSAEAEAVRAASCADWGPGPEQTF